MSYAQELEKLITQSVIPDIDESLDAIFEEIADNKEALRTQKRRLKIFANLKRTCKIFSAILKMERLRRTMIHGKERGQN